MASQACYYYNACQIEIRFVKMPNSSGQSIHSDAESLKPIKTVSAKNGLKALAKACGIQLSYRDMDGCTKLASSESLLAVLRSLGIGVASAADAPAALAQLTNERLNRFIEPVIIAWNGSLPSIKLRLKMPLPAGLKATMDLETGKSRRYRWTNLNRFVVQEDGQDIPQFRDFQLPVRDHLSLGYHRLTIEDGQNKFTALVISAPRKALQLPTGARRWGLFCPLYALHSASSWGAGDFSDFLGLALWSATLGGSIVATLPLLPSFYKEHFNPSPYSPVSRLFWNEFFIDIVSVPELSHCAEAVAILDSIEHKSELSKLRSGPLVDYARQMDVKRQVLEVLSECFFQLPETSARRQSFKNYLSVKPDLRDYAKFRALSEQLKIPWTEWPENLRNGIIEESDCRPEVVNYYLYTQFIAHEQMALISAKAREIGQAFYLDMPLGSSPDGFDVWRNQDIFARRSGVGAPPDPAFTGGQDWGFPPLHPVRLRESEYQYFIDVVRHHLSFAGFLRLDHIMSLHRLFWIPTGLGPDQGIYVRYEAEEMYAILCLESHRARAIIVGEDLGLVPEPVRWAMRRHNIDRSYVAQYEMLAGNDTCLDSVPVHAIAALNTHDMHPFAAFWQGIDIDERVENGVLSRDRAVIERRQRDSGKETVVRCLRQRNVLSSQFPSEKEIYGAICRVLAGSDVEGLLLSIDDLTGSAQAQNIPGTCAEHPNWRRRAVKSLEQLEADVDITNFLRGINEERRRGSGDLRTEN
jgi:4-alpha-glucanotransferase